MLKDLIREKMFADGLHLRDTARKIGVSHNTIVRILEGCTVDVETLILVCAWLGVSPASALNEQTIGGSDKLAAEVALLLGRNPLLAESLENAMSKMRSGAIGAEDIREIIAYTIYVIGHKSSSVNNHCLAGNGMSRL